MRVACHIMPVCKLPAGEGWYYSCTSQAPINCSCLSLQGWLVSCQNDRAGIYHTARAVATRTQAAL